MSAPRGPSESPLSPRPARSATAARRRNTSIRCGPERCGASRTRRACVTASMPVRATFVAVFESASTARTWRPTTGRMRTGATKGLCRCTWAREKRARAVRRLGRGRPRRMSSGDVIPLACSAARLPAVASARASTSCTAVTATHPNATAAITRATRRRRLRVTRSPAPAAGRARSACGARRRPARRRRIARRS